MNRYLLSLSLLWLSVANVQAQTVVEPTSAVTVEVSTTDTAPQIVVKPEYQVGEKIAIEFKGQTIDDAEMSLHWTLPPTVQTEAGSNDGRRLLAWAPPGSYNVQLDAQYTLDVLVPDPDDPAKTKVRRITFPAYSYTATFKVAGAQPEPEPEPKPEPKPLTGLALLVPDAAKRALCHEFFLDLADAAATGSFVSTSHFRTAYRKAIADAQASGELPKGLAALDAPISTRIGAAIGFADVPLDASKQDTLVAALRGIALELNQ